MPIPTVLNKENFSNSMLTQMDTVGPTIKFALAGGVDSSICNSIITKAGKCIDDWGDIATYHRIETGFNMAAQFMQELEEKTLNTKLRFKNCMEQHELAAIQELASRMQLMMKSSVAVMEASYKSDPERYKTYKKIEDSYLPLITQSRETINAHVASEISRVEIEEATPKSAQPSRSL